MLDYFGSEHKVETIANNIKKSFNSFNILYELEIVNNYRCIQVNGPEDLFFWVRLMYDSNTGKYIVDFNNIVLPERYRGKHVFSTIFFRVARCKYVEKVIISSVCTDRMKRWCKSHKLTEYNYNDYYLMT